MFSVVKAVLLNPLPYPESGRIAWVAEVSDYGHESQIAFQNFLDWRDQNHSFSSLAAYGGGPTTVSFHDVPQSTLVSIVSDDFFTVMGTSAARGRTFSTAEQLEGAAHTAVIGHGLWQRVFGADPAVIGQSFRIAGVEATVIGIMPDGFSYPDKAEVWMPLASFGDPGRNVRASHYWRAVGRLRPGITWEQAQTDISTIERRIKREYPSPFQSKDAAVVPLRDHIVGEVREPLILLFGAVGFLLLIVCVNVANLLLVRVTARTRELGVRTALGASRHHLIRQMLTESMLQALAGGLVGMLLASWSMELLRIQLPAELPRLADIRIDAGVALFALLISALAGLLFGLLPAWRASALNVNEALKSSSRSSAGGKQMKRMQAALVVSEVCLSLVLVTGAGLLIRSFSNLRSVDPGFRSDHVLTLSTSLAPQAGLVGKYRDLLNRVATLPGVEVAAITRSLPIAGNQNDGHFFIDGHRDEAADAGYAVISEGYLKAMGIPLVSGRDFNDQDSENGQPVAMISAEMARTFFPGVNPIGRRIWFDSYAPKPFWLTIVGVVADTRQAGVTRATYPIAYVAYTQQQQSPNMLSAATLVVRTRTEPASLTSAVAQQIRTVNPEAVPVGRTMDTVLSESLARQRFQMRTLLAFGCLALLLATIGLYGVLSYMVTANKSQISIRLALGANPTTVFRMVVGRAMTLCGLGAALGVIGCILARSALSALLFGIGPSDPLTIGAAVATLLTAGLVAAWIPARAAMKVDPMLVLRED